MQNIFSQILNWTVLKRQRHKQITSCWVISNHLWKRFISPSFIHKAFTPCTHHARPNAAKTSRSELQLVFTLISVRD